MNLRLLIVDDDTSLCRHLKTFFLRHQYTVEMVHDGLAAVEKAQSFHPHLMFLDIGLPGISGIEVLKQVKEKDSSIRVIMITGQTEDELIRQARVLGADDYVTKPFTLDYLSGEVMDKLHKQLFQDLRSTSEDLALEREKMELLFEQVKEGVVLFDQQGLIFMVNPLAKDLLGLTTDPIGKAPEVIFSGFKATPADRWTRVKEEIGEPFDVVREVPKQLVLECRITPIYNRTKDISGYMMLFRDVSMERRGETAMHRFVSLISHKLRTPLVTIRAYPKLLLSENSISPLNDFQKNALQVIQKQCQSLEDMVNQLIAFSSLDPDELMRQPVVVPELLRGAIKLMPESMRDKVPGIQFDEKATAVGVDVDPTLMQHAIRNVFDNAFKFGATKISVQTENTAAGVLIKISDNGPGIPPEDRERVFERFYQVEKNFSGQVPGAGLGLTMVKQTVESHGGKVWVESQVGVGTTIVFRLPAANVAAAA